MDYRITLCATAFLTSLSLSAATAAAQTPEASVSGPADGINVEPSAAVQKRTEGRSIADIAARKTPDMIGSALAAGAPGVEGAPGTESGR
jgi:hypothetical protein